MRRGLNEWIAEPLVYDDLVAAIRRVSRPSASAPAGKTFALIGAIHLVDEHWLAPLGETTLGFFIIVSAALLWVGAIFLARRILAVDI